MSGNVHERSDNRKVFPRPSHELETTRLLFADGPNSRIPTKRETLVDEAVHPVSGVLSPGERLCLSSIIKGVRPGRHAGRQESCLTMLTKMVYMVDELIDSNSRQSIHISMADHGGRFDLITYHLL